MALKPAQSESDRIVYSMRALGRNEPPFGFELDGKRWTRLHVMKHDFYAVTSFYRADDGSKCVLKMSRTVDFAGVPLLWLGKYLCKREMSFYLKLQDLPNVPRVLGTVGPTGFVHAYVEGHPLNRQIPVPTGFFAELEQLFDTMYSRGIAYVDSHKPQNILQGDDGRPHLIDFQISFDVDEWKFLPRQWLLKRFRQTDQYHLLKHKKRFRPDEMTSEELARLEQKHWLIRLHRFITKPYFKFRRRTFKRLRETGQLLPEGSK